MVESYRDLERNLRLDQLTYAEAKARQEFREKTAKDFILAATGGAIVSWFAGQKFDFVNRLIVTGGASYYCGIWTFDRSLNRYFDHILSLNGTRMQKELAASLLKRYNDNPKIMDRFSKHFYAEKLYDDSSDIPKLRWRFRNFFGDNATTFEAATDDDNFNSYKSDQKRMVTKETNSGPKPAQTNTAVELMENPFECIFGTPAGVEEIHSSGGSNVPRAGRSNTTPKRRTHSNKRHHHRRHRKHHHEASEA